MVEAGKRHVLLTLAGWRFWPPVRLWARFARRFGYRGIALVLFALGFIGIGLGLPYAPEPANQLFYSNIPLELRMLGWVGCGIVALVGAISKREVWQDRGFAFLLLPLLGERLLSNLVALVVEPDTLRWLSGCATWFIFSGIVTLIAAWPEPAYEPPAAVPPIAPAV